MRNICLEGPEDQSVTSTSGEDLGRNLHMGRSGRIRKSLKQYDPGFWAARQWNSDAVLSILYMIQYVGFNGNVDTDDIVSLLAELYAEYCINLSYEKILCYQVSKPQS